MKFKFAVCFFLYGIGAYANNFLSYCQNNSLSIEEKVTLSYIKIKMRAFSCEELNAKIPQTTSLDLSNTKDISDLTPLKFFKNIEDLNLNKSIKIKDLRPLSNLTSLKTLELEDNKIEDLTPLSGLNLLETLVLDWNKIKDYQPICQLPNLKVLKISFNQVKIVDHLRNLPSLEIIFINGNQIKDISSMAELTQLKVAKLWLNEIQDISPLKNLMLLENIDVEENPIIKNTSNCPTDVNTTKVVRQFCSKYLNSP
jgi:internalin A